jgi:hypothetical protein
MAIPSQWGNKSGKPVQHFYPPGWFKNFQTTRIEQDSPLAKHFNRGQILINCSNLPE